MNSLDEKQKAFEERQKTRKPKKKNAKPLRSNPTTQPEFVTAKFSTLKNLMENMAGLARTWQQHSQNTAIINPHSPMTAIERDVFSKCSQDLLNLLQQFVNQFNIDGQEIKAKQQKDL